MGEIRLLEDYMKKRIQLAVFIAAMSAVATVAAAPKGTVTVAYHSFERELMDISLQSISALPYAGPMYDHLIGAKPDGTYTFEFGVLESVVPNKDATAFTLKLKQGLKWHDGKEITAEDLKFTFDHFAREGTFCVACGFLKKNMVSAKTTDNYTVVVTIKSTNVLFPRLLGPLEGDVLIMPKHRYEAVGEEGWGKTPMGSGPWKFVSRKIGEFIEFEANTDYWNPERVPHFARLRIVLAPDSSVRNTMLREGTADLAPLNPEDVDKMRKLGFQIRGPRMTGYPGIFFYKQYDPTHLTNKLEFRKAISLCIDMEAVVNAFYPPEVGTFSTGAPLFSPITAGYDPSIPGYAYDVGAAKKLLKQIGYNNEELEFLTFFFAPNPEQLEVNEAIASYIRECGINVKLIPIDWGTVFERLRADPQRFDPPGVMGVQVPQGRPSMVQNIVVFMLHYDDGGLLATYWDKAGIDKTYRELTAIVDYDERDARVRELQQKWYDEYWAIPIVWRHTPFAVSSKIADWQPSNGTFSGFLSYETLKPK